MIEKGIKGYAETLVSADKCADSMGSGELRVFSTPAMIALVEEAAWKSVADKLDEGCGTVGTRVDIAHIGATLPNKRVTCETELCEVDGRKLSFTARVYDEKGKIGEGTHERFIIFNEKFMDKLEKKFSE